jgi:hypothetical protein
MHFGTRIFSAIDHQLALMASRLARPVPERVLWQRVVLPLCGLALMIVGLASTVTPVPLSILVVIGWPLLLCFHPKVEARGKGWMFRRVDALRRWLHNCGGRARVKPAIHP